MAANAPPTTVPETAVVALAGPSLIAVQPGSLLKKKFQVMARLRAGSGIRGDRWQFSSVELSGIYADWQKTRTEIKFATKQLAKTRELTAAQLNSQSRLVERLRKLVATGTEAARNLASAEASLMQTQLEGQKAIFEAESALTQATHSRADLERHLLQAGVDPAQLAKASTGAALVIADVPGVGSAWWQ